MTKEELISVIENAITQESKYVGVVVETPNNKGRELIINPLCDLQAKLEYYTQTYDDNMCLNANSKIQVIRAFYFNRFESLNSLDLSYSDSHIAKVER